MKWTPVLLAVFVALMLGGGAVAVAGNVPEFTLRIKNHRFTPAAFDVPAGQKVKLIVINEDPTPEEFESNSLGREKIIPGGHTGAVFIGPLKPGKYDFFGDFYSKTAQGMITAK